MGSGKTLIGCITVIHWAVLHRGDYLIGRQFMPELRDTTLKTFLDICPPELIVEYRVADCIIKLRSSDGGVSTIFFRGLEEPDKLRSLNLSGFYLDEANQTSEAAFLLLQGRLRGQGLRKGIMTQNPAGHSWSWRWFVKQDHIVSDLVKKHFYSITAPSTENSHLPPEYVQMMLNTWSNDRIAREVMGSEDAFEGMVYEEFDRSVHVIKPFRIPEDWTRVIGIDHGYRNPTAWIYAAIDPDGTLYVYKEFYEREWLIDEICKKGKAGKPSAYSLIGKDKIEMAVIDPSTRATRGNTGLSDYETYLEHLPGGFPLGLANNAVEAGIDRVKTYLKVDPITRKPRMYIFDSCVNLLDEVCKYRYAETPISRQGKQNEKEAPQKVDDHACDALRYLVMTRPETPLAKDDIYKRIAYTSIEGALYRELKAIKGPKGSADPFGDC